MFMHVEREKVLTVVSSLPPAHFDRDAAAGSKANTSIGRLGAHARDAFRIKTTCLHELREDICFGFTLVVGLLFLF